MKCESIGSLMLFSIRGRLYECDGLTNDKTLDDFWHYGVFWYAYMKEKEKETNGV